MLNREYKYDISFDLEKVQENKKLDVFSCPFCSKVYKTKYSLVKHVRNVHIVDYNLLDKWYENKENYTKELKNFSTTLLPEISNFRNNMLLILDRMESMTMGLINLGRTTLSKTNPSERSFFHEFYMMGKGIVILNYIRLYYSTLLVSTNFTEDLFRYIFSKNSQTEREKVGRAVGLCQLCDYRRASQKHHIIPLVYGGSNEEYNLSNVCGPCHRQDMFEVVFEKIRKDNKAKKSLLRKLKLN